MTKRRSIVMRVLIVAAGAFGAQVATAAPADSTPPITAAATNPQEVECMAKAIVREAGNQPERGQVAIAQVIRTRMKSGRFAPSACGVVKQRGQFFDPDSYNPPRTTSRWTNAIRIATETLNGLGEEVAPGALFFRSARATLKQRIRIVQIADHIFYR
ncbi:cell wall hydrolase [uncultured Sphingomonas sp.]|uniref:cell wall hydrolase n=1 Tax=Sphingomonas sp. TaxID=28214 RepID=UPI002612BF14|nr:cell wall hydrolase [uncultured Sphingomonas sp.]